MGEKYIPLFWKFSIAITFIVVLFGAINIYFINYTNYKTFKKELNMRGFVVARSLVNQITDYVLYEDLISLNRAVTALKESDNSIAYIFLIDQKQRVLAHTFDDQVPTQLRLLDGGLSDKEQVNSFIIAGTGQYIYDYTVPVLNGQLGAVRVGLSEDGHFEKMRTTTHIFIIMVVLFLVLGLIGAFVFAHVITTPVKRIINRAESFDLLNLNRQSLSEPLSIDNNPILCFPDELGRLTDKFNQMMFRLHQALMDLSIAQKNLIQTEKMSSIGVLSAGIAHEINNPIAGIKNCLRRMEKSPEDLDQHQKYLNLMNIAVRKIEQVVTGLLDFSRKHNLDFKPVDLKKTIENVLLLTSYELEKSQIAIVKNYSIKSPVIVGSQNHLEQVFINLIINSIDAINERKMKSPDFSGIIRLNMMREQENIVIEIQDNGIGIEEEKISKIFDPFFTDKKVKQGTGLGLSVSYNIIEQHFGKIVTRRNTGLGMSFSIYLPVQEQVNDAGNNP